MIENFVVHPDQGKNQETDVDILGVRFPYRAENLIRPMEDDARFSIKSDRPQIIIAEVKSKLCNLNGPWTDPDRGNMHKVLRAIGAFSESKTDLIAKALYLHGCYEDQGYEISLVCIGGQRNEEVAAKFPQVRQILWAEVLDFIFRRFKEYKHQKVAHPQWDATGKRLWTAATKAKDEAAFKAVIEVL